ASTSWSAPQPAPNWVTFPPTTSKRHPSRPPRKHTMARYFLGLDCSTQSFTALLLEQADERDPSTTRIAMERSLNFDEHFPEFGTRNGVIAGKHGEVHTPPQLWVKALEETLAVLKRQGAPLDKVEAIGFSGQQHGSVYLNASAERAL